MILGSQLLRDGGFAAPLVEDSIQPSSIDLRLADEFLEPIAPDAKVWRLGSPIWYLKRRGPYVLAPRSFALGRTIEQVTLDEHHSGVIEGRSSIGRAGLFIQNAGWVDPGFVGTITLELYNANDYSIELVPGERICQLVVMETRGCDRPYRGKYQGQRYVEGYRPDARGTADL